MRFLLLVLFVLPSILAAQTSLAVESSKKTSKTSESGTGYRRTTNYVDRVILNLTVSGDGQSEVACYFVARNVQTQALSYFGFEKQIVPLSRTAQKLVVQSEPIPYSQAKARDSTPDTEHGTLPYGWVVIVTSGAHEDAVKASSPDVLSWVRKNPPHLRPKFSP